MIIKADIIAQPYSGEFQEIIFDNESPWNSSDWSYVRFERSDFTEWCGVFRGFPLAVAISEIQQLTLVITSNYMWLVNNSDGNLIHYEDNTGFRSLTVSPGGEFILADYYNIYRLTNGLNNLIHLESPKSMDMIDFKGWRDGTLEFEFDEFTNWNNHEKAILDPTDWSIKLIS